MIVKIQRPLVSNEPEPKALVYNRSRQFEAFMPMTPEIEALFARKFDVRSDAEVLDMLDANL